MKGTELQHLAVIFGILLVPTLIYFFYALKYHKYFRPILIAVITFIPGLYFFLEFALPQNIGWFQFNKFHDQISRAVIIIGAMAIGLGVINILRVHGTAILKSRKGWTNSLALIVGLFVMLAVEGGDFISSEKAVSSWKRISDLKEFSKQIHKNSGKSETLAAEQIDLLLAVLNLGVTESDEGKNFLSRKGKSPEYAYASKLFLSSVEKANVHGQTLRNYYAQGELSSIEERESLLKQEHQALETQLKAAAEGAKELVRLNYEETTIKKSAHFLEYAFFFPLGAAMFSLLAFYIASAAYRTFRVRSLEAMIMMVAALLVMLGQIPHGPLYVWEGLPRTRLWLLENLSTPAFRAIFFGSAIAGLAWAARMWLSLEKSPLTVDEE